MSGLQRITIQALFLSFSIHVIILSLFSFQIPLQKTSFQPFVNFLGSFLDPYDTQSMQKIHPNLSLKKENIILLSNQQKNNPHIATAAPKTILAISLPASKKRTLPNIKIAPITESAENKENQQQNAEEPFQFTPLKLPEHDRY